MLWTKDVQTTIYAHLILLLSWLAVVAAGSDVISATSFSACDSGPAQIDIDTFSFAFSKADKHLAFSVAGKSAAKASVNALININAYGIEAYTKRLDPCSKEYNITSLCPVQIGPFKAHGKVVIPQAILKDVPALAFQIPDLQGFVTFSLTEVAGQQDLSCIRAPVNNGLSLASPKVQALTASVAASAIVVSGIVSLAASITTATSIGGIGASSVTTTTPLINTSPNIGDVFMWFQAIGATGMFTVAYPRISLSFYHNFGWAIGLLEWHSMQKSIDEFRRRTGGNLTFSSLEALDNSDARTSSYATKNVKRPGTGIMQRRDMNQDKGKVDHLVSGISAFAEQLRIPSQNTFMTILVIFMLVEASLVILSALAKIVFDLLARRWRLPKLLDQFRQNFWSSLRGLLLRSLLIIYGTWCLFCLYQFKNGGSWAASLLAASTLVLFNGIIIFFIYKVVKIAQVAGKQGEKGQDLLLQHQPYLQKYGVLYDQFRIWWFFIPCLVYSFVKAVIIALASNHGMVQIIGCIILELLFLSLLCWKQAYDSLQANIVNISISIVRLVSLVGTLLFVDILALEQTTKTVAGIVVIIIQSGMTCILVVLVICNAILPLIRKKKNETLDSESEETIPLNPMHEKQQTIDVGESSSPSNEHFHEPQVADPLLHVRSQAAEL